MSEQHKYTDVIFGYMASAVTFLAGHINDILALSIGISSLAVMVLRLRKEWRHRDE